MGGPKGKFGGGKGGGKFGGGNKGSMMANLRATKGSQHSTYPEDPQMEHLIESHRVGAFDPVSRKELVFHDIHNSTQLFYHETLRDFVRRHYYYRNRRERAVLVQKLKASKGDAGVSRNSTLGVGGRTSTSVDDGGMSHTGSVGGGPHTGGDPQMTTPTAGAESSSREMNGGAAVIGGTKINFAKHYILAMRSEFLFAPPEYFPTELLVTAEQKKNAGGEQKKNATGGTAEQKRNAGTAGGTGEDAESESESGSGTGSSSDDKESSDGGSSNAGLSDEGSVIGGDDYMDGGQDADANDFGEVEDQGGNVYDD